MKLEGNFTRRSRDGRREYSAAWHLPFDKDEIRFWMNEITTADDGEVTGRSLTRSGWVKYDGTEGYLNVIGGMDGDVIRCLLEVLGEL